MNLTEKEEYKNVLSSILTDMGMVNHATEVGENGDFNLNVTSADLDRLYRIWQEQEVVSYHDFSGFDFNIYFNEPQKFISLNFSYTNRQLAVIPYSDWKKDNWKDLRILTEHIRIHIEHFTSRIERKILARSNP